MKFILGWFMFTIFFIWFSPKEEPVIVIAGSVFGGFLITSAIALIAY
ncbi:MAG: hypothetical protein Q8P20_05050 [bacterium]|nr:hypothetical protein [bacterium]